MNDRFDGIRLFCGWSIKKGDGGMPANALKAYYSCQFTDALFFSSEMLKSAESFGDRLVAGAMHASCALHTGDRRVWERGMHYLDGIACADEAEKLLYDTFCSLMRMGIYDFENLPDWLCQGDFDHYPQEFLALGCYAYAKYLCITGATQQIAACLGPMIAYSGRDKMPNLQEYMRLILAAAYHYLGREDQAKAEFRRALDMALQNGYLASLVEYKPLFDSFFDEQTEHLDADMRLFIRRASKDLYAGYAALRNALLGRSISLKLSARELEAAKLAARQLSNSEIARRMGLKPGSVDALLHSIYIKLDIKGRKDLEKHLF